jgi:cysteine-rich repeat protein
VWAPLWGNGSLENAEECDDGNNTPNDGCTDCKIDRGYACTGTPSIWTVTCGDGLIIKTETCDDGNSISEDGWSSLCKVEENWTWENEPSECKEGPSDDPIFGASGKVFEAGFAFGILEPITLYRCIFTADFISDH